MEKKRILPLLGLLALLAPTMVGCSESDDFINLRVLNCEDYIGDSVVEDFEAYCRDELGKNVKVIYDTFDTNETMLSSLQTGKTTYDLICPSDYAIQKMMMNGMLEPFDQTAITNYKSYASPYLQSQLDIITADVPNEDGTKTTKSVGEYACGYMWGTLGLTFNPTKISEDKGIEEDEVKFDMQDWNSLWDDKYYLEMQIKDSMRDTYSVGIMRTFDSEIKQELSDSGYFDEDFNLLEGKYDEAVQNYGPKLASIFNRSDEATVEAVEDQLLDLKENVFGFEVDSGKDDIVKGLVGINLAWSGDAVYSIDRAENENDVTLYYSVPKTGGNIWFDGWVMPKSDSLHKVEAQEFINFISTPEVASANMDSTGYTSFVAGDYVLDTIREWYDPRSYAMYVWHDDPEDWEESDFVRDEEECPIFQDGTGIHEDSGDDYGEHDMTGSSYEEAVVDGVHMSWAQYQSDILEEEWSVTNLTYMFEDTLEGVDEVGDTPDTNPYLFYNDELEEIANPYDPDGTPIVVGRQFYTQYPDNDFIPKLAVMKDFGTNLKNVLQLWENVKANNLPIAFVVTFGIVLVLGIAGIIAGKVIKTEQKKRRVASRKAVSASFDRKGK